MLPIWPFTVAAHPITLADRTNRVATVTISPHRMVGYIAETVTFVAMGADIRGELVHGAKFSWESSDTSKLTIDDAGRATLLAPGMVIVTCRAGLALKTASVLIRPMRRPVQTDQQWRTDQESRVSSTGGENGVGDVLVSLVDKLAPTAHAQFNPWGDNPKAAGQIGTPPFAALEETRLGPVMPGSNFELPMPIVSLGGRGLATSLMLYYNSSVWGAYFDPLQNSTVYAFDPIQSWPSSGFSLGFGRVTFCDYSYYDGVGYGYKYMLIDPNGTRHQLGIGTVTGNNILQTTDGSHITYVGDVMSGTLYYNDGTAVTIAKINNRLLPTQITDTNGNYIQIAYHWETNFPPMAINYIVDTLGRVIQFHYDAYNSTNLTSITTPTGTVSLGYQTVTMNTNFLLDNPIENAPTSFSAISSVTIPQRPTYNFTYSGYGMIYNMVATSGGGTATVTYDYPQGGEQVLWPTFSHRTESPNAIYSYGADGITRPDGTKLILSGPDRELRNTSNATLSKTVSTLTTDPGGSTALQSVIAYDDATPTANQTKVDFDYDQYGNVINKREYGYQISGAWQVRRRTHYIYVNWEPYLSAYIRNLQTEVDVYDALQNTNDADDVLIGRTVQSYDNYGAMGGMENYGGTAAPPNHLTSYDITKTTRGNPTDATSYSDLAAGGVTHSSKRDIFGGITKAQVSCCNQKSFAMTEATYWSRASQTTSGDTSGIYLTSSAVYDFNTLAATSNTDPNNQTATYSYDSAQRPTGFTSPTGANGSTAYNVLGEATSSTVNYSEGGVNKTITTTAVYDGWGQITQSVDANGAQTNYTYDIMGRRLTQTNPFPQGGTPGPVMTYQYDQLGRVTQVTLPGGNTVQTAYIGGDIVTVTDQVNRKLKRETDGLGRLIKVTEQDVSTGALSQETTYTYDVADHLIGVNQGGQTRAFKYDAEGKLLYERIPEQAASIWDGSTANWSTRYTYTDWGGVETRMDARGAIANSGYDSLHRLTSINYNVPSGVAATPSVTYTYDNSQSSTTKGLLLSVSVGSGYSESYSYDSFNRAQSVTCTIDGHNYTTSYQFNTANQATQMTYPSGRVINLGHDDKGRLISVGSFLTGVTYNGIGQLTGTSRGNGVSETYGYDANRMQLTSQTATKSGGPTNGLMNLAYYYQASAGQMGAGSTVGNTGQLMAINNNSTINGTAESASYTYDNLGRLVTSDQTSNGSSAQRRFAYDRWGNRTGMWDAAAGGNQIQTVTLEQSDGVPTNRIQTVYPPRANFALATNGATASASSTSSSSYPASAAINGDRKGTYWGLGGGWMDATANTYPDWIQVNFNGGKTIDEVDVFTLQDNYSNPSEPTESMTFSQYGIVDFQVQYWNGLGWVTVAGGSVTGNNKVWKKITFSQITTSKIRVNVTNALSNYSRVTEVEAWGPSPGIGYTYDAAGNLTNDGAHSYTYDAENRIVSVDGGATAQYAYDTSNQRYKKVTGGATTNYVWQGSQVIAEHNGSTGAVLTDYVYSGSRMTAKVASGTTQYFLSDRLSVRLVLDTSGNVIGRQAHLPFGEDFGESGTQEKHHFTSYERDVEVGSDYGLNRQHAASVGRFMRPDSERGRKENPQTQNRYLYVRDDAINLADFQGASESRVDGQYEAYLSTSSEDLMEGSGSGSRGSSTGNVSPEAIVQVATRQGAGDGESDDGANRETNQSSVGISSKPLQRVLVKARILNVFKGPIMSGALFTGDTLDWQGFHLEFSYHTFATIIFPFNTTVVDMLQLVGRSFWEHCVYHGSIVNGGTCVQVNVSRRKVMALQWYFV